MKRFFLTALALGAFVSIPVISAFAAAAASDSAVSYTGDYNGSNNGTGFGVFGLTTTGPTAGTFIGDSTANGNGGSGGINTGGKSFGVYAANSTTPTSSAVISRSFTAGGANGTTTLGLGQTFSLTLDNGFVGNAVGSVGNVGFNLLNAGGTTRFSFSFTGGAADYFFYNGTSNIDTGVGYTADGLAVAFTQGAGNAFTLKITPSGSGTTTFTSTLAATGDISQFQVFSTNNGSGGNYDLYFNSLVVSVPEPTTAVTVALAGLAGVVGFVRRRRKEV